MMRLRKTAAASVLMLASLAALSACQKQEGPAEQAGKEVDKAVENVGQQLEKAGDKIEDATKRDKK